MPVARSGMRWTFTWWLLLWIFLASPSALADDRADRGTTGSADGGSSASRISIPQGMSPQDAIHTALAAAWAQAGVAPSSPCDDQTFVRRVYLDTVGRIPTRAESDEFLASSQPAKRTELVERLVESPEAARHLAELFDAMLLGRGPERVMERRSRSEWYSYLEESFLANRPWNRMARDMTLARATPDTDVRASWYLYERKDDAQAIAEAVAPAFFGIRIECAQCHDHPLAHEIYQSHYWGLVSFFNRGKNIDTPAGPRVSESAEGGFHKFTDLSGDSFDAVLTFYQSPAIPEERPAEGVKATDADYVQSAEPEPAVPRFSRREHFADEVLLPHPLLAKAFVNRLWALVMGRGIVHPYDRMDSTHPPTHPELLEWLADDFATSGYDVRRLWKAMLCSQPYQLSSVRADARALPDHFAYGLTKPLNAESLLRSIQLVARGETQSADPELLTAFRKVFPDVLAEEDTTSLGASLLLTNHAGFNALLRSETSPTVERLCSLPSAEERVEEAFQIALGRAPDADELALTSEFLQARQDGRDAVVQMLWALVTSAEFRLNH